MTAYAVISDVHANLEALEAVLKKLKKEDVDEIIFLGDCVGYGPNPNECIELLKQKANTMIAGNHDRAAAGTADSGHFNPYAKIAIEWTRKELSAENRQFLRGLPLSEKIKGDSLFLVHGTPKEPGMWHYLSSERDALINLKYFEEKICFLAHSHQPSIFDCSNRGGIQIYYNYTDIMQKNRYIVNTGSVGQPRDGNPDASFVVFKENRVEIKRVSYDIVLTQNKMRNAGLPAFLIERLAAGR